MSNLKLGWDLIFFQSVTLIDPEFIAYAIILKLPFDSVETIMLRRKTIFYRRTLT
jgi:hypothetical protein